MDTHFNDWNQHWSDLNEVTEQNPSQHYRHRMLVSMLGRCLTEPEKTHKIIDFGSGQGDLINLLCTHYNAQSFIGLELSDSGVQLAVRKSPQASFFQCNLLDNIPAQPQLYGSGEIGICAEVLEHLDEPKKMLETISLYLAPNAKLIVTVPSGPMSSFDKSIGHRKHYRSEDLRALLENSGFKVLQINKAGFPFFNLYKIVTIMRGKQLCKDIKGESSMKGMVLLVFKLFDFLFRFNSTNSAFGWQLLLIAEKVPS